MHATDATELAPDESWAYRARYQDPLVEVRVVRLGSKKPPRVLVHFVADDFEGRQDWVPPARLKVPWRAVAEFEAREQRWELVASATPSCDSAELSAAAVIFDLLVEPELAELGYNATEGVVRIHDCDRLAGILDLDPANLRADPTAFEEDGDLIASWTVTRMLATRAAEHDPHRILGYVEREEADARREAVYGRSYPSRGKAKAWDVSPEICSQIDEEHGKPFRAVLRAWSGHEPVDLRAEVAVYRREASRLSRLASAALDELRKAGLSRAAKRLERDHGAAADLSARQMGPGVGP